MPYLKRSEQKVGTLVQYQTMRSLEPVLCVIVETPKDWEARVSLLLPDGTILSANRDYLRRPQDESR